MLILTTIRYQASIDVTYLNASIIVAELSLQVFADLRLRPR